MIEVKNPFALHVIFWWFGMPIIATLLLPYLYGASVFRISPEEVIFFRELGVDIAATTNRANSWFKTCFVDTKLVSLFQSSFNLTTLEIANPLQTTAREITSDWSDGLWNLLFRAFWRIAALWPIYVAGIICFVFPAFVDGLSTRSIKKYNFQVHNPLIFSISTHFAAMISGLAVYIPFLPVSLNALYIGIFLIALAGAVWVLAANFQSGV